MVEGHLRSVPGTLKRLPHSQNVFSADSDSFISHHLNVSFWLFQLKNLTNIKQIS